jgi:hypothetical protein
MNHTFAQTPPEIIPIVKTVLIQFDNSNYLNFVKVLILPSSDISVEGAAILTS